MNGDAIGAAGQGRLEESHRARDDVRDLHATVLHLLGIDHEKLTHRYQGRDFRLTDVHGNVVKDILA